MTHAGVVDGVLYCYGGCGRRYADFGLDVMLPAALWNEIAVGPPFDETQLNIRREGRGGVLCANCIVERLAKLSGVTVAHLTTDEPFPIRMSARLYHTIRTAITGSLQAFVAAHGHTLDFSHFESLNKRIRQQLWAIFRDHPDVERLDGPAKDQYREAIRRAELACVEKAAVIDQLQAELAELKRIA